MKQVALFYNLMEAHIAKGALVNEGIEAEVFEANTLYPGLSGIKEFEIKLMVKDEDYNAAVKFLAASSSIE